MGHLLRSYDEGATVWEAALRRYRLDPVIDPARGPVPLAEEGPKGSELASVDPLPAPMDVDP